MDANWEEFSARVRSALEEQVEGSSEAFKALWSKREDVSIMGADGALDQGWEDVSTGIDWAARIIQASERTLENKVTVVGEDLAMTVDIETVKKPSETRLEPSRCAARRFTGSRTATGGSSSGTPTSSPPRARAWPSNRRG